MKTYDPSKLESKWQKKWQEWGIYRADDASVKDRLYVLDMFPYPSGAGLHVGHTRIYTASDVLARYFRMRGKEVLHPMGWDAFGLPAENDAIKKKINPQKLVPLNIANFKRQMQSLGFSYDWSREINTSDPAYYKWTQWLFLQFFKMGLLYRDEVPINWCEQCKTGLANEEVLPDGTHERCGHAVVKKELKQWLFRITAYADRLLEDLEGLDWPRSIIEMQRNWIGRSEGAEIRFSLDSSDSPLTSSAITVFTTRPDTLFGATALVLAPEHPVVAALLNSKFEIRNSKIEDLRTYVDQSKQKSELQRAELNKEKTGVFSGLYAINPGNGKKIPVWVADYVIGWYGGGAVMLVPAHDSRDFEFAEKYDLAIKPVVLLDPSEPPKPPYEGEGVLVDSGEFTGLDSQTARGRITEWLEGQGSGKKAVSYKLRDWVFSRQRYWGEPIPLVYCPSCADKGISYEGFTQPTKLAQLGLEGWFPVKEEDLPIELPYLEAYEPTGTGESPLAAVKDWVETECPHCGGEASRETDTMPNWAGSCWYFIRFAQKQKEKSKKQRLEEVWKQSSEGGKWLPVDWYLGGAEHAVLHLLYSRFWVKAMFDLGLVDFEEPFLRLRNVGMVQGEDGRKMSKSIGNVVNPDEIVAAYGADTLRVYEMFMGPFSQATNWSTSGVEGASRFLRRVWDIGVAAGPWPVRSSVKIESTLHRLIKKVGEDIEALKFNTAIAAMMEFLNTVKEEKNQISREDFQTFLTLLAPFAPHITEELAQNLAMADPESASGGSSHLSIHQQPWPEYQEALLEGDEVTVVIQIDGRLRDRIRVEKDIERDELIKKVRQRANIKKHLAGKKVRETYVVPNKLVNFATFKG